MQLPGHLKDTTLGDLLGALFRERATGFLDLIETSGAQHRLEVREGKVHAVETELEAPRLGELLSVSELPDAVDGRLGETLIAHGLVSHLQLEKALHRQMLARLELLFSVKDAAIRFRAPRPRQDDPTRPQPLEKHEFLEGRPRKRTPEVKATQRRHSLGALSVLGLGEDASPADIRAAFRELAAAHHPDRHPGVDSEERAQLFRRFAAISRAYHSLVG